MRTWMRRAGRLAPAVGIALLIGAASTHGIRAPAARFDEASVRAVTAAYNASGHDLFARFAESPGNIVLSPYSIGTAMAMALSGARGETESEMAAVLSHTLSRDAINDANRDLLAALNGYDGSFWPMSPSVRLKTANALMLLSGYNSLMLLSGHGDIVSPRYASLLEDKYRAQLFRDAGPDEVNGWVKRQTEGKIEKIVDQFDPKEVAVILNAIYFKGMWQSAFRKNETRESDFHLSPSTTVRVPTMHQSGSFAILRRPEYRAIRLPYRVEALSMVVLLPDEIGGVDKIARDLDAPTLAALFRGFRERKAVSLALPRFRTSFGARLGELFQNAGMRRAFDLDRADFSGVTNRPPSEAPLAISDVIHRAFIEVTEEGTEAAAATVTKVKIASAPPAPEPFVVDRPFLFYIVDDATGAILFEGRISDPRPQ
jgi:serpin B